MVVNDNFVILDVLTYRLESFFTITIADCGMDAVDIVKGQPRNYFDVILMDINMPMMDGFQAIKKIKDYLNSTRGSGLVKMISIADVPKLGNKSPSEQPGYRQLMNNSKPKEEGSPRYAH